MSSQASFHSLDIASWYELIHDCFNVSSRCWVREKMYMQLVVPLVSKRFRRGKSLSAGLFSPRSARRVDV